MANTLYNSSSLNCVQELLYRALGLKLDPAFVSYSLDATNAILTVTALPQAADGRKGIYTGTVTFPYRKQDLSAIVPKDIVFGESYPMTWDRLKSYLKASYDFLLEDGDFYVQGDSTQTPLMPGATIGVNPNPTNGQIVLVATPQSGRWLAGSTLPLTITASGAGAPGNHIAIVGKAPDGVVGQPYDATYSVSGGAGPYTWSLISGTLPGTLNSSTGEIRNDATTVTGSYSWTVRCTDSTGRFLDFSDSCAILASSSVFMHDTFTGTSGTRLVDHTGEIGGWVNYSGFNITYDPTLMLLDGNHAIYASGSSNESTAVSNVVAPQMDFYAELVVNTGNLPTTAQSATGLTLYEHMDITGQLATFVRGVQVYFRQDFTTIYEPDYAVAVGPTANSSISLASPLPSNHTFTLRVEYRFSQSSIKVYIDGVLVFDISSPDYALSSGPPIKPGVYAFDIDSFGVSGEGLTVHSIELGTL